MNEETNISDSRKSDYSPSDPDQPAETHRRQHLVRIGASLLAFAVVDVIGGGTSSGYSEPPTAENHNNCSGSVSDDYCVAGAGSTFDLHCHGNGNASDHGCQGNNGPTGIVISDLNCGFTPTGSSSPDPDASCNANSYGAFTEDGACGQAIANQVSPDHACSDNRGTISPDSGCKKNNPDNACGVNAKDQSCSAPTPDQDCSQKPSDSTCGMGTATTADEHCNISNGDMSCNLNHGDNSCTTGSSSDQGCAASLHDMDNACAGQNPANPLQVPDHSCSAAFADQHCGPMYPKDPDEHKGQH